MSKQTIPKEAPAEIYVEKPGTDDNNGLDGQLITTDQKTEAIAGEELAEDKAEAKKDTLEKNDTSGEAG